MNLIPWKNKRQDDNQGGTSLVELRSQMDRLFDSFVRNPLAPFEETFEEDRFWAPAIDVAENDQEVTVRAEVPGISPDDLEITVAGNRLELSGEKKEQFEKNEQDCYHMETRYGSFRRSIELPSGVDPEQVSAEHANGVVTIKLKKTQAAAAKRIEVKSS